MLPVYADEIIDALVKLKGLEEVKAKGVVWLTSGSVLRLLSGSGEALRKVDFRGSGMQKGNKWAVKGGRSEVETVVRGVVENSRCLMGSIF